METQTQISINEVREVISQIESLLKALREVPPSERGLVKVHLDRYRSRLEEITGLHNCKVEII